MGSCPSGTRVAPVIAHVPAVAPPAEKRKVEVILVSTNDDVENTARCLKALRETCAQHQVGSYTSFENAFNHIRGLDKTTTVILISTGKSYASLKENMPDIDTHSNVRNFFIYSNENEKVERPTETTIQHVFGKRHLVAAIRDILEAIQSSPIYRRSSQQVSFVLHQSSINALLSAIISVQFEASIIGMTLTFRLSQMSVVLTPSMFQFIAQVELVNAPKLLSSFVTKTVYGKAEIKLEKNRFVIAVSEFIIELTKKYGRPDVANYIPTFPLDGYINFGHSFELRKECETKRLMLQVKDLEMFTEEKLVKLFVEVNYIRMA